MKEGEAIEDKKKRKRKNAFSLEFLVDKTGFFLIEYLVRRKAGKEVVGEKVRFAGLP